MPARLRKNQIHFVFRFTVVTFHIPPPWIFCTPPILLVLLGTPPPRRIFSRQLHRFSVGGVLPPLLTQTLHQNAISYRVSSVHCQLPKLPEQSAPSSLAVSFAAYCVPTHLRTNILASTNLCDFRSRPNPISKSTKSLGVVLSTPWSSFAGFRNRSHAHPGRTDARPTINATQRTNLRRLTFDRDKPRTVTEGTAAADSRNHEDLSRKSLGNDEALRERKRKRE